ncbi:MAG: GEVED domain-containing protein [Bacteroidota bacterium]
MKNYDITKPKILHLEVQNRCNSFRKFRFNHVWLLLLFLLFTSSGWSQQKIYNQVQSKKAQGATFSTQELFTISSEKFTQDELFFNIDQVQLLDYKGLPETLDDNLSLIIPMGSNVIELDLIEVSDSFNDYTVITNGSQNQAINNKARHFRGVIRGDSQSLVALSLYEDEVAGFIANDQGNFNITKLKNSPEIMVYNDRNLRAPLEFTCETAEDSSFTPYDPETVLRSNQARMSSNNCVGLYFETEFDIFQSLGTVAAVENYVTALFNQVATLYENEDIETYLSTINIWTTADPYTSGGTAGLLSQFQSNTGNFDGDLGQLLTFRNIGGGRAAGFDGICNSNSDESLCVSGNLTTNVIPFPTYSWNVMVLTHEFGHLFGSRHTHACVWNGNNTAIDGCSGFTEGSCALPGIPSNGGTIMSYCHTQAVGINFNLGFGLQPGNVIRDRVANGGCLGTCADVEPPTAPTNLGVSSITENSVYLFWNASSDNVGVTGYEMFQDGVSIGTTPNTNLTVNGLTEDTTYSFFVRAFDEAGNFSDPSNTRTITTLAGIDCTIAITIPYEEGFESSIGQWIQSTDDDFDWTRNTGGTPTTDTGPSSGSDSSWYLYAEATGNPNKSARLTSPCIDLSSEVSAFFSFDYHMNGLFEMGRFGVQVTEDGSNWFTLWNQGASQGDQWNTVHINLSNYIGKQIQIRFNRLTGFSDVADVAIDNIYLRNFIPISTEYCESSGGGNGVGYITQVRLGDINNISGDSQEGYTDYTSQSTTLSPNNLIQLNAAWPAARPNSGFAVYIDWNHDGDFNDFNELAFSTVVFSLSSVLGNFNIPLGAAPGETRMRVSLKFGDIADPCENFSFGEVEDYTVIIPNSIGRNPLTTMEDNGNVENNVKGFRIAPNPIIEGQLTIKVLKDEPVDYVIYNMAGQQIKNGTFSTVINVSDLTSGMYFIQLNTENGKWLGEFVKQ